MKRYPLPRPPDSLPARPGRQDPLVAPAEAACVAGPGRSSPASPTTRRMRPISPAFARRSAAGSARPMSRSARRGKAAAGARALVEGRPVSLALFDSATAAGLRRAPARRRRRSATIFAFSGQMAQFVPADLRQRFVMDFGDVDSAKFAAICGRGRRADALGQPPRGAGNCSPSSAPPPPAPISRLFVSEAEAALFRKLTGLGQHPGALQRHRSRPFRSRRRVSAPRRSGARAGAAARLHRPDGLCAQCPGGAPGSRARCCR